MTDDIYRGYRHESSEEPWCNLESLNAATVQVEGEEADRYMEKFARDLMTVYKGAITAVERYETERRRRSRDVVPAAAGFRDR